MYVYICMCDACKNIICVYRAEKNIFTSYSYVAVGIITIAIANRHDGNTRYTNISWNIFPLSKVSTVLWKCDVIVRMSMFKYRIKIVRIFSLLRNTRYSS